MDASIRDREAAAAVKGRGSRAKSDAALHACAGSIGAPGGLGTRLADRDARR